MPKKKKLKHELSETHICKQNTFNADITSHIRKICDSQSIRNENGLVRASIHGARIHKIYLIIYYWVKYSHNEILEKKVSFWRVKISVLRNV